MLKTALMFAASGLALAMFAPDLVATLNPTPGTAARTPRADARAPVEQAAIGPQTREHEVAVRADGLGQFSADAVVNGQSLRMLIDTGASFVVLSAEAADRIGIVPPPDAQRVRVHTANGDAQTTLVTLNSLEIGPVYVPQVQALIAERSAGEVNLVGMSFLRRLAGVEQRHGDLYLRQ